MKKSGDVDAVAIAIEAAVKHLGTLIQHHGAGSWLYRWILPSYPIPSIGQGSSSSLALSLAMDNVTDSDAGIDAINMTAEVRAIVLADKL